MQQRNATAACWVRHVPHCRALAEQRGSETEDGSLNKPPKKRTLPFAFERIYAIYEYEQGGLRAKGPGGRGIWRGALGWRA